jgi:Protein of unknown function (DUF1194)
MILVPLFDLKFHYESRRYRCRNFKSAALAPKTTKFPNYAIIPIRFVLTLSAIGVLHHFVCRRRIIEMRDRPRLWLAHWLTCALLLAGATPAPAQADVDLLLVLAVDASGSVDAIRFDLQKRGYVAAFRHARVLQAIRSGANQAIAATMVQWTGPTLQVQVVGWSRIGEEQTATAFAAAIEAAPRRLFGGGTSISGAIDYGSTLLAMSPFRAHRRIIDVSGDGSNNRGRPVNLARDEAVAAGMGINGLPILALEPDLDRYYYDNVIGGPGAFVVAAQSYDTFADAILKKLITEIAARER